MPRVKQSEALPERPVIVVLYGDPGTSKTTIGNTTANPILIDADHGVARSLFRKETLIVNDWDEVLAEDQNGLFDQYSTVVIDTPKALLDDYLVNYVIKKDPKLRTNKLGMYGAIGDEFKIFTNGRRNKNADIFIVCHSKRDEDNKRVIPDVTGGSFQLLMRIADQVGYLSIKNGKRVITFDPSDVSVGKNVARLPDTEVPDIKDPAFSTFGADMVAKVKVALATMSEEQVEAEEKSKKYQEQLKKITTPDELLELVNVVNELPEYLKLPLRQLIAVKADTNGWQYDKENKVFAVKAKVTETPAAETDTPPAPPAPPAPAAPDAAKKKEKTLKWFKDRIGKRIHGVSATYNGTFPIADLAHAEYLFNTSQKEQGFVFSEEKEEEVANV